MLRESLDIRPVDNVACGGNLIEVFRGSADMRAYFDKLRQVTHHLFPRGKIGGNHFHKEKFEIIYVSEGELEVYLQDLKTKEVYSERILQGYKFNLVRGVAHALHNPTRVSSQIFEFTNLAFNPDSPRYDVYMLDNCLVSKRELNRV